MSHARIFAGAVALAVTLAMPQARAAATDYRFELVGKPLPAGPNETMEVRLVHVPDGKPVPDAVIFEVRLDMAPAGMDSMTAQAQAMPPKDGLYSFTLSPSMTGTWALHLAAKVQGETETVRGTVTADLVK